MSLQERENKRKKSIVGSIAGIEDKTTAEPKEKEVDSKNGKLDLSFLEDKRKTETKSKRISFLVKPSVYEKSKVKSKEIGVSMNEVINSFLEEFIKD